MISKKAILASVATAVVLLTTVPVHGVTCNSVAESSNIETCPLQSSLNGTEVKLTAQSVVEDKTVKEERIYHYEKNRKYMAEVKTYYNTKADRTEAAKKLGVDSEKSSVSNMLNYNLYEEDGLYVLEVQIPSAYAAVDGIDKTYKLALEQKVFRTTLKGSTEIGDNCELITKFILPYDIVDSNCEYEGNTVIIKGTEGKNIWAIGFKADTSSSIKVSGIKDGCVKRDGTGQFNIKVTCDNDIFTSSKLYIKDNTRYSEVRIPYNEVIVSGDKYKGELFSFNYFSGNEGSYKLVVKTPTKEKIIKFKIDSTLPTLNVKNNATYKKSVTIKAKDNFSGVKTVKVNGKTVKNNTKLSKKGTYNITVTDKAGNSCKCKIYIR